MLSTETTSSAPTSGPSIGSIELLMGAAVAVAADGSERGVVVGDALYEGEVVKVDGQSTVEIRLGDNSLHRLSADGVPAAKLLLAQNDNVPVASDAALGLREQVRQAVSENSRLNEVLVPKFTDEMSAESVWKAIEGLPPTAAGELTKGELTEAVRQAVSQNSKLSDLFRQYPDDLVAAVIDELPVEIALQVINELPPPAAGELSDGHSFVVIPLDLPLLTPQAGFETEGLGFAFPEGIPGGALPVFAPGEIVPVAVLPSFSINDVTVTEGDPFLNGSSNGSRNFSFASVSDEGSSPELTEPVTITFTVTRTGTEQELSAPSTVSYTVVPGSAVLGGYNPEGPSGDYTEKDPLTGTLDFAAGQTTQTITLNVTADFNPEPTETFTVVLSDPIDATITKPVGVGTILDNDARPALDIDKTADVGQTADVAGEQLTYAITVANTGNLTLSGVTVTDPTADPGSIVRGTDVFGDGDDLLEAGETWSYTAAHTVTQAELDSNGGGDGDIDNVATANSNESGPDSDDATVPVQQNPALAIVKSADAGQTADVAGEQLTYAITVANAGNLTLSGVTVTDPAADPGSIVRGTDLTGDNDDLLEVGETWSYAAAHTVTQAELDSNGGGDGDIDNVATADSNESGPDSDDATVPVQQNNPALIIDKTADAGQTADVAGEQLTYSITVTNTGNQTLNGVTVTDPTADPGSIVRGTDLTGNNDDLLEVGETWSYAAAHTVTQTEIDSNGGGDGDIDNVATADSNESGPDSDDATVPVDQNPALTIVKSADAGQTADVAGEQLTYSITVANAGNLTLSGVTVTDPTADPGSIVRGTDVFGDGDDLLEAGETWSYTAAHTVTQAELDSNGGGDGDIDNVATANSNESGPDSDDATVPVQQNPALAIVKSADAGQTADVAGEQLTYAITVANAGNLTLSGVTVTDPTADPGSIVRGTDVFGDGDDLLEVGETWSYTAAHTVTQAELDSNGGGDGDIDNVATANSNESGPDSDDATVPVQQNNPALIIDKTADAGQTADVAGEQLTYSITVTNTGNQTLNGVTVTDPTADPGSIVRGTDLTGNNDALLEAGETWSYTAAHTVTQAELDSNGGGDGDIDNVATANSNESGPDSDDATVPVQQNPALAIVKSADAGQTADVAGEQLTYSITVANAGNLTLSGVTVTDPTADPGSIVRGTDVFGDGDALLEAGETWSYTAAHTVTQAELDSNGGGDGDIDNVATANSNESGPDSDDATVPVQQNPALAIVKSADAGQTADVAGEKLTYSITVANAGNLTLSGVTVTDPTADPGSIVRGTDLTGDNDDLLEVGETWSYTAAHTVTQAELDSNGGGDGDIDNVATANSNESGPDSDDATVPVTQLPSLFILDSAATEGSPILFAVRLVGGPASAELTVDYQVIAGVGSTGATTPQDYGPGLNALNGTLTFAIGDALKTITLNTVKDGILEGKESFTVQLSNLQGPATIARDVGTGTIDDEQGPPPPTAAATSSVANDAQTFTVNEESPVDQIDQIAGFSQTRGDVLDLTDLIEYPSGASTTPDLLDEFVQIDMDGADAIVSVDSNGDVGGASFVEVATLLGVVTASPINTLVSDNHEAVAVAIG